MKFLEWGPYHTQRAIVPQCSMASGTFFERFDSRCNHDPRSTKGFRDERISTRSGVPTSLKCSRKRPSR